MVLATLVVGGAVDANHRHPGLESWHRLTSRDLTAGEMDGDLSLPALLAREDEFHEVAAMEASLDGAHQTPVRPAASACQ